MYLGAEELEQYCYEVGAALGLRLSIAGEVIPIEWRLLPGNTGLAQPWSAFVIIDPSVMLLHNSGRDMRRRVAMTYVHECCHLLTWQALRRLQERQRLAWDLPHDYPFAVLNWALSLRLQRHPDYDQGTDRKWWPEATGPSWYDIQDAAFVPTDGSIPQSTMGLNDSIARALKWWQRAVLDAIKWAATDLQPHELADAIARDYVRMTTPRKPAPPPTIWQRFSGWLTQ